MLAFAISGFLAGVAGALFVLQQQLLVDQTFTPDVSLRIFAMVVVGGLGSISGAVLGATFVYGVQYFLPAQYRSSRPAPACCSCCCSCRAAWARCSATRATACCAGTRRRNGIRVPSLVADTLVEPAEP